MKFRVTTFGVLFCALAMTFASGARAADDRMTISDIYNFANRFEDVINQGTPGETRDDLAVMISSSAQFSENIARPQWQYGWTNIAYGYPYAGYYGYPYAAAAYGYAPANSFTLSKGGEIDRIVSKKHSIANYQVKLDVTNIQINPFGNTAMVSLNVKEFGRVYSPYYPQFVQAAVQGNSSCRLYLTKNLELPPMLTRLDCNTNSNLPL